MQALGLDEDATAELVAPPMRGGARGAVPTDPTIYRLYEIVQVRREPDPKGDRVEIVLNGKFLPYEWRADER